MGQTGRESVERWVTWVIGHKIWPIVSSNVCLIGLHMDQLAYVTNKLLQLLQSDVKSNLNWLGETKSKTVYVQTQL